MMYRAKIFQIRDAAGRLPLPYNMADNLSVNQLMSRWCSFLLLSSIPCFCFGQVGVNIKTLFGQSNTLDTVKISQDGMHASVEYNFRLKEKRLEFRPGIGYRFTWNGAKEDGYFRSFDIDLNTAIYPFDFGGDCHCPTFSKSGDLFKKGFFLELNPGVGYQVLSRLRSDPDDPSKLPIRSKNIEWKIGGTAGLDIGLSDHYTLTPLLSGTLLSSSDWDGLRQDGSNGQLTEYFYLGTGVRFTYSSDDKRRRRN